MLKYSLSFSGVLFSIPRVASKLLFGSCTRSVNGNFFFGKMKETHQHVGVYENRMQIDKREGQKDGCTN